MPARRISDLTQPLFRKFTTKRTTGAPNPLRFRPKLEQCEDRTVPTPVVTVQALADATEGGAAGTFRFTRTETSGSLYVSLMASGTASAGSDYTGVYSVNFADGQATVDLNVTATDDSAQEATETLTYTIVPFYIYTVGTPGSATINLYDNDTPVVTVAKIADATEGGTAGTFRFTRSGSTYSTLTANFTVSGTATSGTDFTALGTSVTFGYGQSTVDVTVTPTADAIYDPDETVSVTATSGTGYSVGTSATAVLTIADDIGAVQTLIHEETFQLSGSSGDVFVTLTVTLNAPGAAGLYMWNYAVTNPSANGTSLTTFSVPIDGMDDDVTNLSSSVGWTGTVGSDSVSWAAGTGLAPGATATFSFTTDPREIGPATITATGTGGAFLANLPTAPAPRQKTSRPMAKISFGGTATEGQAYELKLDNIAAANGGSYTTGWINVAASSRAGARDIVYLYLKNNGWAVEKSENGIDLFILGRIEADKSVTALKSLTYKFQNVQSGEGLATPPQIFPVGQLQVAPSP